MKSSLKATTAMLIFSMILVVFGQLSVAYCESTSISDKALAYIENVLPLDMECYTVTPKGTYEPPKLANTTYRAEFVSFELNSSGSLLWANCQFRDGVQYTCSLQVSGLPISDRPYANLAEVTRSILEKHHAQTGVDASKLIIMLDAIEPTIKSQTVTWGNLRLAVTQTKFIIPSLVMRDGSLHVASSGTSFDTASFSWSLFGSVKGQYFFIDYRDGVFYDLTDNHLIGEINTDGANMVFSNNNNTLNAASTSNPVLDITPPIIASVSIQNKSYSSNEIPLTFNINENVSKITYSLDDKSNMTITGNTTITGLSNGVHNLTIYATDYAGNIGTTQTINFNVIKAAENPSQVKQQVQPQSFPTASVIAAFISVTVFLVGVIIYFKRFSTSSRNLKKKLSYF